MAQVFIGVGSNIDPERNIKSGVKAMRQCFGELVISPIYESVAVGFEGDNFYNFVVRFETELSPKELAKRLHEIEFEFGRNKHETRFSSRTLDLDLLLYDDLVIDQDHLQIPREDVLKYAFVLKPLAEIAGELTYPVTGERYNELWNRFDKQCKDLWSVNIDLD